MALLEQNIAWQPYPAESYVFSRFAGDAYIKTFTRLALFVCCSFPLACMGEERGCIGSWWGNKRERDHWGDLGVDGWIILGWISRRWDVGIWTG